jgi:hypothetical protein
VLIALERSRILPVRMFPLAGGTAGCEPDPDEAAGELPAAGVDDGAAATLNASTGAAALPTVHISRQAPTVDPSKDPLRTSCPLASVFPYVVVPSEFPF